MNTRTHSRRDIIFRVSSIVCSPSSTTAVCSANAPSFDVKKNMTSLSKSGARNMIKMKQYSVSIENSTTRAGSLTVWDIQTGQQRVSVFIIFLFKILNVNHLFTRSNGLKSHSCTNRFG